MLRDERMREEPEEFLQDPDPENNWTMTGAAVDIVDLQALRLEKTISVPGAHLRAVAWDGGRYVYAASSVAGELVRIDVETDTLDERLRLAVGRVYDIIVDPVRRVDSLPASSYPRTGRAQCPCSAEASALVWR